MTSCGLLKKIKHEHYLCLQKQQVRTETSDLLILNQYEQYTVSVQEVCRCKILVETWHFEVYHHVNKEKQPQVENVGEYRH